MNAALKKARICIAYLGPRRFCERRFMLPSYPLPSAESPEPAHAARLDVAELPARPPLGLAVYLDGSAGSFFQARISAQKKLDNL